MKYVGIALAIVLVIGACFLGYNVYNYFEERNKPEIETIETVVEVFPERTYEGLKEDVIELKEDEEANKEEIEVLREALSVERKAFLASDDTILIKTISDDTILLYRDKEGILQAGSDNITKIIEHRDIVVLPEEISVRGKDWDIKVGGFYSFEKTYGIIVSKEIFSIKDYSLNVSILLDDFEAFRFNVGGDVGYEIRENLEIGVGYNTSKEIYVKLQYEF